MKPKVALVNSPRGRAHIGRERVERAERQAVTVDQDELRHDR